MAVSYNNLWKLMIDKKINKSELCKTVKISSSTMAKMSNEEMVQCRFWRKYVQNWNVILEILWSLQNSKL
ncbi:helix-turn-helix domain-containing protein [Ruminiclostridium josui]|uniref:helix-turn-helix domain-containing protein n=1 Tax=Ruminiclostridium josui TaxID=1499 RepID=UPI001FA6D34B|nr:helix-turn-helix transcriptional regulator [Ruminiclostridium josui]